MKRQTLGELQDQVAQKRKWKDFPEAIKGEEWEKLQYIKYEALELFHAQEVKALQEEIDRFKWISVDDRLPEHAPFQAEQVIVNNRVGKSNVVICAIFYNGDFFLIETWSEEGTDSDKMSDVSHWMPLSEPPKQS